VPGSTTYLRLELPARGLPVGQKLSLDYADWEPGSSFPELGGWLELTKEIQPPVLEGSLDKVEKGFRLVTISGTTGESFVFQHFNNERVRTFNKNGLYWLSTLQSGAAADHLDAGAVLTRRDRGWSSERVPLKVLAADVVRLGEGSLRQRKVSIVGTSELFFQVSQLGEFEFLMPKTALRVLPLAPTWQYSAASEVFGEIRGNVPFKEGGGRFKLDPGYYVLQLEPREQDVVELTIRSVGAAAKDPVTAPHGVAVLGEQELETRFDYTVFVNAEPGVEAGLVLRESPVDPRQPLPLLAGAEPVVVPVTLAERGLLRARAEDGSQLALTVDGVSHPGSVWLDPGTYQAAVALLDPTAAPVAALLEMKPAAEVDEEPLPALPVEAMTRLPIYPQLDDRAERFFDLDRGGQRTFLVRADEPALYRLESSGLLDT